MAKSPLFRSGVFLLSVFATVLSPALHAVEPAANAKVQAQACADGLISGDFEAMAQYTHKRVVDRMGGKEKMVAAIKAGMSELKAQNVTFDKVSIGDADKPREIAGWLIVLGPQKIVMGVRGGHLTSTTHLLGISEDKGLTWRFADVGPITAEQFAEVFPELAGKLDLPAKAKPVFAKD